MLDDFGDIEAKYLLDTYRQIAEQQARIDFIKNHPAFFGCRNFPDLPLSAWKNCKNGLYPANFSNFPGDNIWLQQRTLSAPGVNIPSFNFVISADDEVGLQDKICTASDTSFAAPQVSGAAATLLSNFSDASGASLAEALLKSATPLIEIDYGHVLALPFSAEELDHKLRENPQGFKYEGQLITSERWNHSQRLFGQGR